MKVSKYLPEIRHAVVTVINEMYRERDELSALRTRLNKLTSETDDGYRRVDLLAMNPDLDEDGLGTAIYWDTYFGADKERYQTDREVREATERVIAHEFSIVELAGSLLQYAKRALSLRFGTDRTGIPPGRQIYGIHLHEIIWQARNQAIHWEDGTFHKKTKACFDALAAADAKFAHYKKRSMALEIVLLLSWKSFDDFEKDIMLFDV